MVRADTSQRILDTAERLVQTRGFNGFSYADIATTLGVTKASLHYHFPAQGRARPAPDRALRKEFSGRARQRSTGPARTRARNCSDTPRSMRDVLRNNRMCLCGMLAAEYATLPKPMKEEMKHFFDENERWLTAVLKQGQKARDVEVLGAGA